MATAYWIKGTAGLWNDTANWSASSGGAGGAAVPTTGDTAIFDGNGLGNCDVSAGFYQVAVLDLQSGYTGIVSGDADRTFTITSDLQIASGATLRSTNLFDIILLAGAGISELAGTLDGTGTLVLEAGSFVAGTYGCGTVRFGWNSGAGDFTNTLGSGSFIFTGNVELYYNKSYGNGTFALNTNNPSLEFRGDLSFTGANPERVVWTKGTGTVTIGGTADQDLDFDGETVEDIVLNKSAGTATLTANVTTDSLTITDGALDLAGFDVTVTGSMSVAAAASVTDLAGTSLITVGGNFAINGTSGNTVAWNGPDLDITGTATASYAVVDDSDASAGTNVTATNSTDGGGNAGWDFGAATGNRRRRVIICGSAA